MILLGDLSCLRKKENAENLEKHEDDLTLERQFINVQKKSKIVKYLDTESRVPILVVHHKVSSFDGQSIQLFRVMGRVKDVWRPLLTVKHVFIWRLK